MDRDQAVVRLRSARVGRLASVRPDGRPHVVPFVFALVDEDEGFRIYWAVDHKRKRSADVQRLRNLAANPAVELVVDGFDDDWDRLWWVRASGTSRTVEDPDERARGLEALGGKYRQYAERPPEGEMIVIDVAEITGWEAV